MSRSVDPSLVALFGSEARALSLGVLANAKRPMTGYRVAKVAGLPKIKAYAQLKTALEAGWIRRVGNAYWLPDGDLRSLLRKRVLIFWSDDWLSNRAAEKRRAEKLVKRRPWESWYDSSRFAPNPEVARRYTKEIERSPQKDVPFTSGRAVGSRKDR